MFTTRQACYAMMAAFGLAVSVHQTSLSTASAGEPALLRALQSPQRLPAVKQVNFSSKLAMPEDEAEAKDADAKDADASDEDAAESTVAMADYKALLERVDDLESTWDEHKEKLADEAAAKKKKPAWKLNGRIHLDNWNFTDTDQGVNFLETADPTDDPEDRWDFRRVRLTFSGTVPNNMLYRIQIDFNNPSAGEAKDVYFGFNNLPWNQTLLIGNQKRPIGLDHLNSSRHNVFAERPLAVETFNEDARRLGVCMYGHSDDDSINWRYGAFLLENLSRDGRIRGDFDEGGLYGRLAGSPLVRRDQRWPRILPLGNLRIGEPDRR